MSSIPCILFAFKGLKKDTIIKSINEFSQKHKIPLDICSPDIIIVLDRDFYICRNDGWQFPVVPIPGAFFRDWAGLPHENLVGCYNYLINVIHAFSSKSFRVNTAIYFEKSILKSHNKQ